LKLEELKVNIREEVIDNMLERTGLENIGADLRKLGKDSDIHPYFIMGEFVNHYEGMIRPALKKGNIIGAKAVIANNSLKLSIVEGSRIP